MFESLLRIKTIMFSENYQIKTTFGKNVYLAQRKCSGDFVALKKIPIDSCTDEQLRKIVEETRLIQLLDSPHIITVQSVFVQGFDVYFIYPFFCFGSCKEAMTNFFVSGFPECIAALILRDVLTALEYLHRRGIVHRSIRAEHILLNQTHAVLTGFREATSLLVDGERVRNLHALPTNSAKSINWYAPEVLEQNLLGYSEKSDIYSVGITTCELANGIAPFADLPATLMLCEKIRGNQPSLLDCSTMPSSDVIAEAMDSGIHITTEAWAVDQTRQAYSSRQLSDVFHKFAEHCLARFPENRPSAAHLLQQHAFFKQCKHTSLEEQLHKVLEPVDFNKIPVDNPTRQSDSEDLPEIESLSIDQWDF